MTADRRWWVAPGAAVAASLLLLAWLAAGLGGQALVQRVDNLSVAAAPLLAAAGCGWAGWRSAGRTRAGWLLLAASCGSWGVGQVIWTWYELVAGRQVPFPSLADAGFLGAVPLAVLAMLALASSDGRVAWRARALLDGCIIATALLYASWALVLGPVFRARAGSVLEQVIALLYPAGDVVVATIVFVVLAGSRRGPVPLGLLGAALLCLTVADTAFAYFTQTGAYHTGFVTDVGWFAGYLLVAAAALRPARAEPAGAGQADGARVLLPYCPLTLAVAVSVAQQLRHQQAGPFLYWCFAVLVLLVVGRQLLTVLDNQALNRQLAGMVGRLEHQVFHDPLTGLANRALFRDRVAHALALRARDPQPLATLFVDLDDFKTVNDTLGHASGDALLVAVAERLRRCVRGEDTLARLGGDEFAILLDHPGADGDAVAVAGRIVAAMEAPVAVGGASVRVTASVGVAVSSGAQQVDEVLHQADVAMYTAKARGKDRFETATQPSSSG
jgi:diguanylate cyclase (GGDEF)-like protein